MTAHQLREWRRKRGLSQVAAAEAIGCSRRSIQNWEKGKAIPEWVAKAIAAYQFNLPAYGIGK